MRNKTISIIITLIFISIFIFSSVYVLLSKDEDNSETFTFAWMSDTQYYSESYPEIFTTDVNYILDYKDKEKIKYVIHTGDIVDNMKQSSQCMNANNSLKLFDHSNMPYGILAGNHDVNEEELDYSKYSKKYGKKRFNNKYYYGGSYKNNRGHYYLISISNTDFIIVYMGYGIQANEYSWMNNVLKANKNRKVYSVLTDYQYVDNGGNGYIRLIKFDPKYDRISFKTYSPKLHDFNCYDNNVLEKDEYGFKDEFSFPFEF